jgi:hypothetical protein
LQRRLFRRQKEQIDVHTEERVCIFIFSLSFSFFYFFFFFSFFFLL